MASSNDDPHDRMIDDCDAAQSVDQTPSGPSSVSLAPLRRGSVTYHITRGWSTEKLSERIDVSVAVLDKHYDARTREQKREGLKEFIDLL